jgi:large subunit ribosomal protein L18
MITKSRVEHRNRIKRHIRLRLAGTPERPRLTVFKSIRHVYVQIVDDTTGKTLLTVSDLSKELRGEFKELKGQTAVAKKVGQLAGRAALDKKITAVVFDRNGYLYHGVVKALADGAREAGLKL